MSPYDDDWLGGFGTPEDLMARGDNLGALFLILHEVGATAILHGKPVTASELRQAAVLSAANRIADIVTQALPIDPVMDERAARALRKRAASQKRRKF